jgi:hypothetical protein
MSERQPTRDLSRSHVCASGYDSNPTVKSVDSTTGATLLNLAEGRYRIKASQDVYFLQGDNTITAASVLTDEATPSTSHPIFGGETVETDVTSADDNSLALKTAAGTALVWVTRKDHD